MAREFGDKKLREQALVAHGWKKEKPGADDERAVGEGRGKKCWKDPMAFESEEDLFTLEQAWAMLKAQLTRLQAEQAAE